MTHGSTQLQLQAQETPGLHHERVATLRRGAILGVVVALHLGLLALLFGPVNQRRQDVEHRSGPHDALQFRWVQKAARPLRTKPAARHSTPARQPPPRAPMIATAAQATPTVVPADQSALPPAAVGDYHSPLLLNAAPMSPRSTPPRLPGGDTARVGGLALRDKPSLQHVVRAMTKTSRCKYIRMKMVASANQFITAQLMDRTQEADGCGPQVPHTADDQTVEAISHQAIFGD